MSNAGQPKEGDLQLKFARHLFENQQLYKSKVSDGKIISDNMETLFKKWADEKKNPAIKTPSAPTPVVKRANKSSDSTNSGETDYDTEMSKILANTRKVNGTGICGTIHCNPPTSSPSPPTPPTQNSSSPTPTPEGTFGYHRSDGSVSTATTNTETTTTSTSSKSTETDLPSSNSYGLFL